MKKQDHLPLYGPGPFYVFAVAATAAATVLFRKHPLIAAGRPERFGAVMTAAGIALIALGIFIWIEAVIVSRVDDSIRENRLVTTGIYAWLRNPIYSAAMIAADGVLLIAGNLWYFPLPLLYWLLMTVLMKHTEEKWLRDLYGTAYEAYCARVNRCWPRMPKKD